jgi:TonB-linked SusC/RagA family outer membrane protein
MKKILTQISSLMLLCFAFQSIFLWGNALGQARTISGKVTSAEDGNALPGVNITVKGTSTGVISDADGTYRIGVPADATTLVFSFIGFRRAEVVIGNRTEINQVLQVDTRQLNEVVVTSFGIQKEKKELGYAVQEVKGQDIAETNRPNFVTALQGRVAGLNVGTTSGMAGSSSAIVLRGGSSIGSNNQPLFVVDGVPVDNSTANESFFLTDTPNRNSDYTNRIADIDPNDIENVTVLKGPAASALYGIDAANGAIIITTKRGKKGSMRIDYNANFMMENATRFPEIQTRFANGLAVNGVPTTNRGTLSTWGAERTAGEPTFNNAKNFFQTGFMQNHSLSASGGNDYITYQLSTNIMRQGGVVPETDYGRNSFRLNLTSQLSKKLKANVSANYINSTANRGTVGQKGNGGLYYYSLIWPAYDDVTNFRNDNGTARKVLTDNTAADFDPFENPLLNVNRNKTYDVTDRYILNGSLSYEVTSWFNLTGRIGSDVYRTYGQTALDPQSQQRFFLGGTAVVPANVRGVLFESDVNSKLVNSFLLANFKKKFNDINANLTLGLNYETRSYRVDSRYGEGFLTPDIVSIINTAQPSRRIATRGTERRLFGVFGELKLDYKNMLFLSVTGRQDHSSTLPPENSKFFYPSVSTAFVFSEALGIDDSKFLSYGKVRASFAQVGKDALPHQVFPALQEFIRTGGGYNVGFFGPNPTIKPETTVSYEGGFDVKFFNNRLGIDFTYYYMESRNQIVQPRLSYATGYILQLLNSGVVQNKGVEILLTGSPVKSGKFSWDVIGNFTLNRNRVTQMPADLPEFYLSDTWLAGNARAGYVLGESMMSITGYDWQRNANGEAIVGTNGIPLVNTAFPFIGNRQPKFTFGLTNRFQMGPLSLSVLFDFRVGGDVYNATERDLVLLGLSPRTLDRGTQIVFDGVTQTGERNTVPITLDQLWYTSGLRGLVESQFVEKNINAMRLRDLTLSYALPKSLVEKTKIVRNLAINLTGTNLLLLTNYTGADPDVNGLNASARGSGAMGFDYFSLPQTVAFALGIRAGF